MTTWPRRKRREFNKNPVRRDNVASCELYLEINKKEIQRISRIIMRKFGMGHLTLDEYRHHIEDARQSVIVIFCQEYERYCAGLIDKFPPFPGYLLKMARYYYRDQYFPYGDLLNEKMDFYDTSESSQQTESSKNSAGGRKVMATVATRHNQLPFNSNDPNLNSFNDKRAPDMVDLWNLGFSINELAMIYPLHPTTIRRRIHTYYDAMEKAGVKPKRPRPRKFIPHKNIFKTPKKI